MITVKDGRVPPFGDMPHLPESEHTGGKEAGGAVLADWATNVRSSRSDLGGSRGCVGTQGKVAYH